MAKKHLTLAKVEMAEFAIAQLLECDDFPAGKRAPLIATAGLLESLRPQKADPAAHTPVAYAPGIFGCSCGARPAERATRGSMTMAYYHGHLAKLGLPRTNAPVIAGYGPNQGQPI